MAKSLTDPRYIEFVQFSWAMRLIKKKKKKKKTVIIGDDFVHYQLCMIYNNLKKYIKVFFPYK